VCNIHLSLLPVYVLFQLKSLNFFSKIPLLDAILRSDIAVSALYLSMGHRGAWKCVLVGRREGGKGHLSNSVLHRPIPGGLNYLILGVLCWMSLNFFVSILSIRVLLSSTTYFILWAKDRYHLQTLSELTFNLISSFLISAKPRRWELETWLGGPSLILSPLLRVWD
jgi:hypothetical protein